MHDFRQILNKLRELSNIPDMPGFNKLLDDFEEHTFGADPCCPDPYCPEDPYQGDQTEKRYGPL